MSVFSSSCIHEMVEDKILVATSSNNPSLQISPVKLDGNNLLITWAQFCLLFIKARGLQGYITGDARKPVPNKPTFNQWDSKNSRYGMAHQFYATIDLQNTPVIQHYSKNMEFNFSHLLTC